MWELISDRRVVHQAQQQLTGALIATAKKAVRCRAGYQGGNMPITAHWLDQRNIWFATQRAGNAGIPRHWNAFGIGEPRAGEMVNITCEINFPLSGVERQVEGAIVRDSRGASHIVHRGGIGGGRKGIGRKTFFHYFRGERVRVRDDGQETDMVLVADLRSPRLVEQIDLFVREVDRIKKLAVTRGLRLDGALGDQADTSPFRKEPVGRRRYQVSGWREPTADHGLVVNALASRLERRGRKIGKDINRDLVIRGRNGVEVLFEIKSGGSLADIYAAVGQLFYRNSSRFPVWRVTGLALHRCSILRRNSDERPDSAAAHRRPAPHAR